MCARVLTQKSEEATASSASLLATPLQWLFLETQSQQVAHTLIIINQAILHSLFLGGRHKESPSPFLASSSSFFISKHRVGKAWNEVTPFFNFTMVLG